MTPTFGLPFANAIGELTSNVIHGEEAQRRLREMMRSMDRSQRVASLCLLIHTTMAEAMASLRPRFFTGGGYGPGTEDLETVLAQGATPDEKRAAAERLASHERFRNPIPAQVREAHRDRLKSALADYAARNGLAGARAAVRHATWQALMIAGQEANTFQDAVYITVGSGAKRERFKIINPPGGVLPRPGLPPRYLVQWLQSRVRWWVLNDVLPDFRDHENQYNAGARVVSLDELRAQSGGNQSIESAGNLHQIQDPAEANLAEENAGAARQDLARFASPQQLKILTVMAQLLEEGEPRYGLAKKAAERLGVPPAQVNNQMWKLKRKLAQGNGQSDTTNT